MFGPKGLREELAGKHWFASFMERNSRELFIQKSEGLSLTRAKGMNYNQEAQNEMFFHRKIYT
jgi:hypothetical protein